jgi:hypothetical protein
MTIRWGDLSIWISGASLLLALSIMLHDRIRQRREQVEAVAAWATIDVESLTLTLHVRNTNTLPIFAVDIDVGVCWNDQDIDPPRWLPAVIYNRYAFARARQRTTWDYVPNPPPTLDGGSPGSSDRRVLPSARAHATAHKHAGHSTAPVPRRYRWTQMVGLPGPCYTPTAGRTHTSLLMRQQG